MGVAALAAASVASSALAAGATAADLFNQENDFTPQPNQMGPQPPHRTLTWDSRTGHWGLDLDVTTPSNREMQWSDTRLGVNYRVAPNLRAGVGVALGPELSPDNHQFDNPGPVPRVRLQTSFKF